MQRTDRSAWSAVLGSSALFTLAATASAQVGTVATVPGTVVDMAVDASGDLLYVTEEGEIGSLTTAGVVTQIAAPAAFTDELDAIAALPGGGFAVFDEHGDIWTLPTGALPATLVYDDLYMVREPRDLLVDVTGRYLTTGMSATSGVRAVNWMSSDGQAWAYYLVQHDPIALAARPDGKVYMSDGANAGNLRLIDPTDPAHGTTLLDGTTKPGFAWFRHDGDIAVEADNSAYFVAGGVVYHYDDALQTTSWVISGLGTLRSIVIAASSGSIPSASGWSIYFGEGSNPTTIREIGNAGAPASAFAPDLGPVPTRGNNLVFFPGIRTYELATDLDGNLLIGGDHWTGNKPVKRVDTQTLTVTTIADSANGIDERVEGLQQAPDGTIWVAGQQGNVWAITETGGAPIVEEAFVDPLDQIVTAKDLLLDRDGSLYLANRTFFGGGDITRVGANGVATPLVNTSGSRGIIPDPFEAELFVVEWNCIGFCGTVGRLETLTNTLSPVPGFTGFNLANDDIWADGRMTADVEGNVYICAEDEWSVHRWEADTGKLVRIASSYLDRPAGVAIAPSTPGSGSTTGWSLYVAEFIWLWEIPGVPAPAPEIADASGPPVGRTTGWFSPEIGETRSMVADPAGGGLIVSTSTSTLERVDIATGAVTTLATASQGLSGDLGALDVDAAGHLIVANRDGVVFDVDPQAGYAASVLFDDALDQLTDVRGLSVDGLGRIVVVDRPAGLETGRVFLLDAGQLELAAHSARGLRSAIDPLTGDVFVSEQGAPEEGRGEILRVDTFASPPAYGHWVGDGYLTFDLGPGDGGLAFDADGNFYVAAGDEGRVARLDRTSGTRVDVGGGYANPRDVALAPGTPGVAGAQGNSLFVLDRWAIFEVGVNGDPAGAPPASSPSLAPRAEMLVHGTLQVPGTTPLSLSIPSDPGLFYIVIPSFSGKTPGLPVGVLGPQPDTRNLPINIDNLFPFINLPGTMDAFFAQLDGNGDSPGVFALTLPNNPAFLGVDDFMDFAWMTFDLSALNGIKSVGGTAQVYFGL